MLKKLFFFGFLTVSIVNCCEVALASSKSPQDDSSKKSDSTENQKKTWTKERAINDTLKARLLECCSEEEQEAYRSLLCSITPDFESTNRLPLYNIFLAKVKRAWDILEMIRKVCSEASAKLSAWAASSPIVLSEDRQAQSNFREPLELANFQRIQRSFTSISGKIQRDPFNFFAKLDQTSGNYALIDFSSINQGLNNNQTLDTTSLTNYLTECGFDGNDANRILNVSNSTGVKKYLTLLIRIFEQYGRLIDAVSNGSAENEINGIKREIQQYLGQLRGITLRPLTCTIKIPAPEPVQLQQPALVSEAKQKANICKFVLYAVTQFLLFSYIFKEASEKSGYPNKLQEILLTRKPTPTLNTLLKRLKTCDAVAESYTEAQFNEFVSDVRTQVLSARNESLTILSSAQKSGGGSPTKNNLQAVIQAVASSNFSKDFSSQIPFWFEKEKKEAITKQLKTVEDQLMGILNGRGLSFCFSNQQSTVLAEAKDSNRWEQHLAQIIGDNGVLDPRDKEYVGSLSNVQPKEMENTVLDDAACLYINALYQYKSQIDARNIQPIKTIPGGGGYQFAKDYAQERFGITLNPKLPPQSSQTPKPNRTQRPIQTQQKAKTPQPTGIIKNAQPQTPPNGQKNRGPTLQVTPRSLAQSPTAAGNNPSSGGNNKTSSSNSSTNGSSPRPTPPSSPRPLTLKINSNAKRGQSNNH